MKSRFSISIRLLIIAALVTLTGPRPLMADGERVVICGGDGLKRVVVFDFETGAPAETPVGFENCADCISYAPVPLPVLSPVSSDRLAVIARLVLRPLVVSLVPVSSLNGQRAPPLTALI